MKLLRGKPVADELLKAVANIAMDSDVHLRIIQIGDNPASTVYVGQKIRTAETVGIRTSVDHLPQDISLDEVVTVIGKANTDKNITGIIIQLPLPDHLMPYKQMLLDAIDPEFDVDGLSSFNQGRLMTGLLHNTLLPATPSGIMRLLDYYDIDLLGKQAVIVGRSNVVGKPMAHLLLSRGATVTICHSQTSDLKAYTSQADILIVATGIPRLVTVDMVKPGVVLLDVGMSRIDDKWVGDSVGKELNDIASARTPVPGGVGPLTVASLMWNCVEAIGKD
jgi:methylenetetrahydrofolate dehydrogenase (NADP+)/methenyltetrahydrofolate cyclohydrolase